MALHITMSKTLAYRLIALNTYSELNTHPRTHTCARVTRNRKQKCDVMTYKVIEAEKIRPVYSS